MQPEKLGPFRIDRVIGRGGMGAVYEGIHEQTGESAAVKVLLSTLDDDNELRLRFEAEIDTLKRLRHPNIVRLFGFGEEQGMLYYVMEMVDGPSLHQEIKRQRLFQWHEVAKIGLEMCLALKHGHDRGITHRDIKPANILLENKGSIKLSDYGIAHFFGGQRLTEVNSVVGTLEYMSPEQSLANPVGPRSDLYSLGAVLYVLLVGRPPFSARNLAEIVRKHQRNAIESIRSVRLDAPDELEGIIFDLLKIRPEERPHNAYLVAKRFQSLMQALVGPPERILVKPMTPDSPTTLPLEPVRIPYKDDDQERIGKPRGLVIENGIIDLGGIVDGEQTDPINREPVASAPVKKSDETTEADDPDENRPGNRDQENGSLVESFGRPGSDLEPGMQTVGLSGASSLPEPTIQETYSLSLHPPGYSSEEQQDSSDDGEFADSQDDQLREDYRRLRIPHPEDVDRFSNRAAAGLDTDSSQKAAASERGDEEPPGFTSKPTREFTKKSPGPDSEATVLSSQKIDGPEIRHGEMYLDDLPEIRRAKDEPIPDFNVYETIKPPEEPDDEKREEPDEVPDPLFTGGDREQIESGTDNPTVDGIETGHRPESMLPSSPGEYSVAAPPLNSYDLKKNRTLPGSKDRKPTIAHRSETTSRFVSVTDQDFDPFEDTRQRHRPVVSLQTVFASCCLILIGLVIFYVLQPVPPDLQYERIIKSIEEGTGDGDFSIKALRRTEEDIKMFLLDYPQYPKAEQLRFYQEQLDLDKLEREVERKLHTTDAKKMIPVQRAYMEAVASIKTDPERTIMKLKALIDLYRSDSKLLMDPEESLSPTTEDVAVSEEKAEAPKPVSRSRRGSRDEDFVFLAARQLERLERDIDKINAEQIAKLQIRMEDARKLEALYPDRAESIRRAIVELYQNRAWAEPIVKEAREALEKKTESE